MKKPFILLVSLLSFIGMSAESIFVGAQDGEGNYVPTAVWWNHFSDYYTFQPGDVMHFVIKNYNNVGTEGTVIENWNNLVSFITNDVDRGGQGYSEFLAFREDRETGGNGSYWGSCKNNNTVTVIDTYNETGLQETDFLSEMNGATLDITATFYENGTFTINEDITLKSGKTFKRYAACTNVGKETLRLFFTVERSYIEIVTAEKVDRVLQNRAGLDADKGWSLVADAADLKAKAQSGEYFFTITDSRQDVMVAWNSSTLSYKASVDPVEHLSRLFYIEHAIVGDDGNAATEGTEVYNLRNVEHSKYLMQTGDAGSEHSISYHDQAITVSWANIDIDYLNSTSACTFAWHMHKAGGNYFGAWDEFPDLYRMSQSDIENLAGNKKGSNIGTYAIYAIKRNDFLKQYVGENTNVNLTKFLINPSFESMGWESRGKWLGWSQIEGATANMDYVDNTPDINKDGTWYLQKWHAAGTYGVQQTVNHLTKGVYQLNVATAYDGSSNIARIFANDQEQSFNGLNQQSIVRAALTDDDNSLTIGAKITNAGNNRWFAIDNFRLTYVGKAYINNPAVADKDYIQPGQTVTVTYSDKLSAYDDALSLSDNATVTIGEQEVTVTLTADGFTFVVPQLAAGLEYTLSIPAGVVGYANAGVYNEAQEITFHTPAIYDQECYLYNVGTEKYLSRGMGGGFSTAAKVDDNGIKLYIETDANNKTSIKYTDTNWYAYNADWCWSDGESAAGRNKMLYTVAGNDNDGYVFTATNGVLYVYTAEGGDKFRVANNGTTQYAENCNIWKIANTATATPALSYAGTASVSIQHPVIGGEVSFSATPNTGYLFDNWTDAEGKVVSAENPYVMVVNEDVTLTANFKYATEGFNVGNENNTSAWWTAFSPYYDFAPNSAKHISFIHHCNDHGWPYEIFGTLFVTNTERGANDYTEYVATRMDNNINTQKVGNANWGTLNGNSISGTSASNDGNTLLNFLNGAKVDMYIYREGTEFFYKAEFTKNGTTYVKNYWTKGLPEETLKFFFTGQNAWMEDLVVENIEKPVASEENPITIGAKDYSTFYKFNFHKPHVIKDGEAYTYTFKNHHKNDNHNAWNYILWFKDANKEMVLRADKVEDTQNTGGEFTFWNCNDSWNFHETLDNATVTVTIYNNNGVLGVNADVKGGNGNNFTYAYKNSVTGDVTSILSISYSWLELTNEGVVAMPTTTLADNSAEYASGAIFSTVNLTRTLKAGYNSFALPFAVDAATVESVFGENAVVYELNENVGDILRFTPAESIVANMPYILYVENAVVNPSFSNTTVMTPQSQSKTAGDWTMHSNFTPGFHPATAGNAYGFVNKGADGGLIQKAGESATTNGMRSYFIYSGSTTPSSVSALFLDEEVTGIENCIVSDSEDVEYYSISGTRLSAPVSGINIVKIGGASKKIYVK